MTRKPHIESNTRMKNISDIISKLSVSKFQKANGATGRPLKEVMKDIRKKIWEKSTQNHSRPKIL